MNPALKRVCAAALLLVPCACAVPVPHVTMLPGTNMDMSQFNGDDIACRVQAKKEPVVQGKPPAGLGMGAEPAEVRGKGAIAAQPAPGSMFGGAVVPGEGNTLTSQQRYDTAYIRCMFSKGHKVPVSDGLTG